MNKKVIWVIIGMMAAALVGITWLQVNWIRFSINLNEEQFDNNAMAALNKVSERFEYEEQLEFYNFMNFGTKFLIIRREMNFRVLSCGSKNEKPSNI